MAKINPASRSHVMSSIRSRGNKSTERRFRACLVQAGLSGWRMHAQDISGKPDFVFDSIHLIIFVDGCFWHGCPECNLLHVSSTEYWHKKIGRNRLRDKAINSSLRQAGWRVIRIWEHQLRDEPLRTLDRVIKAIKYAATR